MKLVTWNINSIKARIDTLVTWLRANQPDVVCLQELKVEESAFPRAEIYAEGYDFVANCQKTYNGVAVLSRWPLENPANGMSDGSDDTQARLASATVAGVRVISAYFPNGERVGSEKFEYKLEWMTRLRAHLDAAYKLDQPLVLCGDFNVAGDDRDVWGNPSYWGRSPLYHPDVRSRLERIKAFGFEDVFRKHRPEPGLYSWWDYRVSGSMERGEGLRIDHVYATPSLASKSTDCVIDQKERAIKKPIPSDHAPVVATFDWPMPATRVKVPPEGPIVLSAGQGSLF